MNEQPIIIASGEDYERFVCDLVNSSDFATASQTKATGDQGVDVVVTFKGSGIKIAIQCKLYSGSVGNDAVQQVVAGRIFYGCDRAMVVTNSTFTEAAKELANATGVSLLHHTDLVKTLSYIDGGKYQKNSELLEEVYVKYNSLCQSHQNELRFMMYSAWQLKGRVEHVIQDPRWKNLLSSMVSEAEKGAWAITESAYFKAMYFLWACYLDLRDMMIDGDFGEELGETIRDWMDSEKSHLVKDFRSSHGSAINEVVRKYAEITDLYYRVKELFPTAKKKCLDINFFKNEAIYGFCGFYHITAEEKLKQDKQCKECKQSVVDVVKNVFGDPGYYYFIKCLMQTGVSDVELVGECGVGVFVIFAFLVLFILVLVGFLLLHLGN